MVAGEQRNEGDRRAHSPLAPCNCNPSPHLQAQLGASEAESRQRAERLAVSEAERRRLEVELKAAQVGGRGWDIVEGAWGGWASKAAAAGSERDRRLCIAALLAVKAAVAI